MTAPCTESTYYRAWSIYIERGVIEGALRHRFDGTVDLQSGSAQGEAWRPHKPYKPRQEIAA